MKWGFVRDSEIRNGAQARQLFWGWDAVESAGAFTEILVDKLHDCTCVRNPQAKLQNFAS
jgi:hypothetical protein